MYQALYRKWRPKTFADVIGQSHITRTLQKQVSENRISHAYLFTGTRGTGKTTCAKILAKAINCEHPVDGSPCGQCAACTAIDSGTCLDVLELDAASNNGVDQIRALREEAVYTPANVRMRVYIVDEVHMLSMSAFNALLKILEEPPEHLMFILATTELHKVPATILSRCQRFSFKRIHPTDVQKRLQYVADQEGIALTEDGAELLSRLADGALRDGLSLLDQCAAAGGTVDSSRVLEVLGLAGNLQTAHLMERILQRDAQGALLLLDELYTSGREVGAVLGELSTLTRDLLIGKTVSADGRVLLSGGYDAKTLQALGKQATSARLLALATTLQSALANLYYSANRRTDAELCLLRLCDETLSGDLTALAARIERLEQSGLPTPSPCPQAPISRPTTPKTPPVKTSPPAPPDDPPPWETADASDDDQPPLPEPPPDQSPPGERVFDVPPVRQTPVQSTPPPPAAAQTASATGGTGGPAWWQTFYNSCGNRLPPMYRPFLSQHCTGTLENGLLTVYADTDITKDRINNDRVLSALQEAASNYAGGPVQVRLRVGTASKPVNAPELTPELRRKRLMEIGSQYEAFRVLENKS